MRTKVLGVLIATTLLIGVSSVQGFAGPVLPRLSDYTTQKGPGIAFIVMKSGKVLQSGYYGYWNREKAQKVTKDTRFNLASNSKQFTAMAALILVDQGLLALDDSVSKYIPELPQYAQGIKIRHLVFHTAGLPDYMSLCSKMTTNREVLDFLKAEKALIFPAGTKHEYSNTGYVVLSEVVQRASKKSFDRFIADEIFKKLGMNESFVLTSQNENAIPSKAVPYDDWPFFDIIDRRTCDFIFGDGGVHVTIGDYGKWLDSIAKGTFPLLKKPGIMFDAGSTDDGKVLDYGYGWQVDQLDGNKMIAHSGLWAGHKSFAAIFPYKQLSIAVLSNYRTAPTWRVTEELANKYLRN